MLVRPIIVCALCVAALAAAPAAAAPVAADYTGTTTQHHAVSFRLRKSATTRVLKPFRVKWDATCPGTDLVFHGAAKLGEVHFTGGRFAGAKRNIQTSAGANRVATTKISVHGAFSPGGGRSAGRWRAQTRVTTLKGAIVARCHSGLVRWKAKRSTAVG
jgi:coenzyme F420-reducing hydrogenase delta subunit